MEVNIGKDESIDDLQLNGLQLIQKEQGFRFGVDAVLLSHFANVKKKHRVIDLCTGTGIVVILFTFPLLFSFSPACFAAVSVFSLPIFCAALFANTRLSSKELLARRFAP